MIVNTCLIFAILSFVGKSKRLIDFNNLKVIDLFDETMELKITYFNLLRVYYKPRYERKASIMINAIIRYMWNEYMHMCDWREKGNGKKVYEIANQILSYQNEYKNIGIENNEEVDKLYEQCISTFNSLSLPSTSIKDKLSKVMNVHAIIWETLPFYKRLNCIIPVPVEYGFILLLIKEDEINDFFDFNPIFKKMFIIDLMNQAIINIYDTIIKICIGLNIMDDEMLNILNDVHTNIIDATESILNIQENRTAYEHFLRTNKIFKDLRINEDERNRKISKGCQHKISSEVDTYSDDTKQPEHQSELIDMYHIYIKYLEEIYTRGCEYDRNTLNKYPEIYARGCEYERNDLNKYPGRLVEYKENEHTIRVPVKGYYNVDRAKEYTKILSNNMKENQYYELLMEIRVWISMIKIFADKMKDDMIKNKHCIDDQDLKYLAKMKEMFIQHRASTFLYFGTT